MAKRPGRTADSGSRGGEGFGAARRRTAGRSTAKAASRPDTLGTYVSVPGSRRAPSKAAQRLRDADPNAPVEITITLRGPKLPDASNLAQPAMTPDEFRKRYAASPEDASEVARVLQRFGLKVEELSLETRSMRVKGPVAAIEAAFQPKLAVYKNEDQGLFRDRDQDYKIPIELKGTVPQMQRPGLAERGSQGSASAFAGGSRNAIQLSSRRWQRPDDRHRAIRRRFFRKRPRGLLQKAWSAGSRRHDCARQPGAAHIAADSAITAAAAQTRNGFERRGDDGR